jgi:hypothetical protein
MSPWLNMAAGIVPESIWGVDHAVILPDALAEDRKRRNSMITCLEDRFRQGPTCMCPGQATFVVSVDVCW